MQRSDIENRIIRSPGPFVHSARTLHASFVLRVGICDRYVSLGAWRQASGLSDTVTQILASQWSLVHLWFESMMHVVHTKPIVVTSVLV